MTQAFDSVGRLNRISSAGTDYLSQASYNAAGETLGFGSWAWSTTATATALLSSTEYSDAHRPRNAHFVPDRGARIRHYIMLSSNNENLLAGTGPNSTLTFDVTKNQIQGLPYDPAGNLTNDTFHTYAFDAGQGSLLRK